MSTDVPAPDPTAQAAPPALDAALDDPDVIADAQALVFVAMPFGKKRDPKSNYEIDFDAIYSQAIRPAILDVGLHCIRADEEGSGGVIHLQMFERLLLAEYAIVDVTIENANVFYELGIRHAALPRSTIITRAHATRMPFDINMMRAVGYTLTDGVFTPDAAAALRTEIAKWLRTAALETKVKDSPLFQLIPDFPGINLPHTVTESFRDRARAVDSIRGELAAARALARKGDPSRVEAIALVRAIEDRVGTIDENNAEVAADLMLAYRDLKGWNEMIAVFERIPKEITDRTVTLCEQYALALNRRNGSGDRDAAVQLLEGLIAAHGDNPETCGIIGRIYKDQFAEAKLRKQPMQARGYLAQAIEYYERGFNADWRDYYPGINLATLLAIDGRPELAKKLRDVLSAVSFAVGRLGGLGTKDYWTLATVMEVAVLGNDWAIATDALAKLLTFPEPAWMFETTANNLTLLRSYEPGLIELGGLDDLILELLAALPPESVANVIGAVRAETLDAYLARVESEVTAALRAVLAGDKFADTVKHLKVALPPETYAQLFAPN